MKTERIYVKGMFCKHCEEVIETAVLKLDGILKVTSDFNKGIVDLEYNEDKCDLQEVKEAIKGVGYELTNTKLSLINGISLIIIIIGIWYILNYFGLSKIFQNFPLATSDMSYTALFIIGLFTSFHCIAMCGGLNIAATASSNMKNVFWYNFGRLMSYTIIGGMLGLIGSLFTINMKVKATIGLFVALLMLILGLRFLNIETIRLPNKISKKLNFLNYIKTKFANIKLLNKSLSIGLLNGFMPCGPLQTMQFLAIATGSFVSGALSLFFFCIGTVPLMTIVGLSFSSLSAKFKNAMASISGVLIIIFAVSMLQNNLTLLGLNFFPQSIGSNKKVIMNYAVEDGNIQVVNSSLRYGDYDVIVVKNHTPVRWIITADKKNINGCNNEIIIPKFDIDVKLVEGENIIEFTPRDKEIVNYSCWMGMIKSQIIVE